MDPRLLTVKGWTVISAIVGRELPPAASMRRLAIVKQEGGGSVSLWGCPTGLPFALSVGVIRTRCSMKFDCSALLSLCIGLEGPAGGPQSPWTRSVPLCCRQASLRVLPKHTSFATLLAIHPFIQQKIFDRPYGQAFGAKLTTGAGVLAHFTSAW